MTTITVSPEELRARARELRALRQQHLDLMKKMRILVLSLSEDWQGDAQKAFEQNFLAKSRVMNDLASTLEKYAELMESAAKETEKMDQSLLQSIKSLL